jgi:zinc-ribbon domain
MSSETSTESRRPAQDAGFQAWHFFLLLSMIGATAAVMLSRQTHPAALVLLSVAVVATGLVGIALHRALAGFVGGQTDLDEPVAEGAREQLLREKAFALRSIKELEFDHAMGKVSDKDYQEIGARLRARAPALMEAIEGAEQPAAPARAAKAAKPASRACPACGTPNDPDAKFCKQCGGKL